VVPGKGKYDLPLNPAVEILHNSNVPLGDLLKLPEAPQRFRQPIQPRLGKGEKFFLDRLDGGKRFFQLSFQCLLTFFQ
jgi:hypothetical protein